MTMDINEFRILITVVSFVMFIGIVYWAMSSRQKTRFEEAANLPFLDDDVPSEPNLEARENDKVNISGARS